MKVAWLTDIHLNFISRERFKSLLRKIELSEADALVITGDIAEAEDFAAYLLHLQEKTGLPIYFVLGNHDYYRGTIESVRERASSLAESSDRLFWLDRESFIALTGSTSIVGHGSWADGRSGDYENSNVEIADFELIADFYGLDRAERLRLMQKLAEEASDHLRRVLPLALDASDEVILATHVPPFKESTWYRGEISDDMFRPYFCSSVVGDTIAEVMGRYPSKRLMVLCGHTHGSGESRIADNILVVTGGARYGMPTVQRTFDF